MKFNKSSTLIMFVLSLALILSACGSKDQANDGNGGKTGAEQPPASQTEQPKEAEKTPPPPEPVTITFFDPNANVPKERFMEQYGNAIQSKYPHITTDFVSPADTAAPQHIANRITTGEPMDIILNADLNHFLLITPFNLEYDITDLIKTHNFDLSTIEPSAVKAVQELSNGKMYSLPYSMNTMALMYNKDLFERFGQEFPQDGLTWDEAYNIAAKMTRTEADVSYRGFITQFRNFAWVGQRSLGFVDPKTDKPLMNTDERWKDFVRNLTRFYEIPGNESKEGSFGGVSGLFFKDQVAAMYAYFIPGGEQDVNWDLVTLPTFPDQPEVGSQGMMYMAYITSLSKHKDAAFQAISYMTGEEIQMAASKKATFIPISSNPAVRSAFGSEAPHLEGKNVAAIMKHHPASPLPASTYNINAAQIYERMMYRIAKGEIDLNTAFREIEEETEAKIKELKEQTQ